MLSLSKREIPPHLLRFFKPRRIYKPKDDLMIPHRVYDALMADGWYGRQDIVWSKLNPMPESVRDRCTKAHEYIFLLTKAPRYFWDAEAVKENFADDRMGNPGTYKAGLAAAAEATLGLHGKGVTGNGWNHDGSASGRNIRSVWTIATQSFSESHFATFPTKLAERCIKAGTSEKGACPVCGSPWVRVVEKTDHGFADRTFRSPHRTDTPGMTNGQGATTLAKMIEVSTTGWHPTCTCPPHDPVPCVVLDPFAGAGTVGLVADRLGRDAVLLELSPEYVRMIEKRIVGDAPLFAAVEVS